MTLELISQKLDTTNDKLGDLVDAFKDHVKNHNEDIDKVKTQQTEWKGVLKFIKTWISPIIFLIVGGLVGKFIF